MVESIATHARRGRTGTGGNTRTGVLFREVVYRNTLEGMGAMPPRGGKPNLTEEQVKMAVDYLIEGAGGWPEEG